MKIKHDNFVNIYYILVLIYTDYFIFIKMIIITLFVLTIFDC